MRNKVFVVVEKLDMLINDLYCYLGIIFNREVLQKMLLLSNLISDLILRTETLQKVYIAQLKIPQIF